MAAGYAAVAPRVIDWILARVDDDGVIEIGLRDIAAGADVGVSTVESLMARWKAIGFVRVLRRGGAFCVTRWRFDGALSDAAAACTSVHPNHGGYTRPGAAARGAADGGGPPLPALAPVQTRCPFCEMPPGHALCRHGWDGMTTRAARRDMMLAVPRSGALPKTRRVSAP